MTDTPEDNPFEQIIQVEGNLIAFEFTMRYETGQEIDSNVGGEPMVFHSGAGEMLPALEEALLKMAADETASITLTEDQAYGPITELAFKEFPLDMIPEEARQIGRKVISHTPDGSETMVDVVDIKGDKVVLDFNHPLAGQTLIFNVKVLTNEPFR
jgi:FKBP-type peptidyl-prolyl cis-trans isomerase 2